MTINPTMTWVAHLPASVAGSTAGNNLWMPAVTSLTSEPLTAVSPDVSDWGERFRYFRKKMRPPIHASPAVAARDLMRENGGVFAAIVSSPSNNGSGLAQLGAGAAVALGMKRGVAPGNIVWLANGNDASLNDRPPDVLPNEGIGSSATDSLAETLKGLFGGRSATLPLSPGTLEDWVLNGNILQKAWALKELLKRWRFKLVAAEKWKSFGALKMLAVLKPSVFGKIEEGRQWFIRRTQEEPDLAGIVIMKLIDEARADRQLLSFLMDVACRNKPILSKRHVAGLVELAEANPHNKSPSVFLKELAADDPEHVPDMVDGLLCDALANKYKLNELPLLIDLVRDNERMIKERQLDDMVRAMEVQASKPMAELLLELAGKNGDHATRIFNACVDEDGRAVISPVKGFRKAVCRVIPKDMRERLAMDFELELSLSEASGRRARVLLIELNGIAWYSGYLKKKGMEFDKETTIFATALLEDILRMSTYSQTKNDDRAKRIADVLFKSRDASIRYLDTIWEIGVPSNVKEIGLKMFAREVGKVDANNDEFRIFIRGAWTKDFGDTAGLGKDFFERGGVNENIAALLSVLNDPAYAGDQVLIRLAKYFLVERATNLIPLCRPGLKVTAKALKERLQELGHVLPAKRP